MNVHHNNHIKYDAQAEDTGIPFHINHVKEKIIIKRERLLQEEAYFIFDPTAGKCRKGERSIWFIIVEISGGAAYVSVTQPCFVCDRFTCIQHQNVWIHHASKWGTVWHNLLCNFEMLPESRSNGVKAVLVT